MVEKICKCISIFMLVILLCLAALLALPHVFGIQPLVVKSASMEPAIPVGSMVYVKPTPFEDIKVRDVITYQLSNSQYVTHRVIEVHEDERGFRTQGDANSVPDGALIPYSSVQGKVVFDLPLLGFFSDLIKSRDGILLGAGILILLVLVTFLPEIFATPKDDIKENGSDAVSASSTKGHGKKKSRHKTYEFAEFVPFEPYDPEILKAKLAAERANRKTEAAHREFSSDADEHQNNSGRFRELHHKSDDDDTSYRREVGRGDYPHREIKYKRDNQHTNPQSHRSSMTEDKKHKQDNPTALSNEGGRVKYVDFNQSNQSGTDFKGFNFQSDEH